MHPILIPICIISLILSLSISIYLIIKHLTNFHEPRFQLYIVRIILIIPIYAIDSYVGLIAPKYSIIIDTLKDCYDGYVLYIFIQLLVQYLGGEQTMISHLEIQGRIKHPWPFSNRFRPIPTNRTFYRRIKQGALQFSIVKPVIAGIIIALSMFDLYHPGRIELYSGYVYCSIITDISISISLYCLILFYIATEERLHLHKPLSKYLVIIFILFFSFWQSFAISLIDKFHLLQINEAILPYQYILMINELVLIAITTAYAFTYKEFIDMTKSTKPLLSNLSQVLNMKDVLMDAKANFVGNDDEYEKPMKDMIFDEIDEEINLTNNNYKVKRRY